MSSILGPIAKLSSNLTGLTSDTGDVIQRQFTATPEQPQPSDFPAMIIEIDPETENSFEVHALGAAHNVYCINIMILVGTPAVTPISELHNKACAWIKPLATSIFTDITLSGTDNVLMLGFGGVDTGAEAVFKYHIQAINWNQQLFYGVRAKTWIKEDFALAMA